MTFTHLTATLLAFGALNISVSAETVKCPDVEEIKCIQPYGEKYVCHVGETWIQQKFLSEKPTVKSFKGIAGKTYIDNGAEKILSWGCIYSYENEKGKSAFVQLNLMDDKKCTVKALTDKEMDCR